MVTTFHLYIPNAPFVWTGLMLPELPPFVGFLEPRVTVKFIVSVTGVEGTLNQGYTYRVCWTNIQHFPSHISPSQKDSYLKMRAD